MRFPYPQDRSYEQIVLARYMFRRTMFKGLGSLQQPNCLGCYDTHSYPISGCLPRSKCALHYHPVVELVCHTSLLPAFSLSAYTGGEW